MVNYMFPPNIEFDDEIRINFITRTKLKDVLIQALFLNNLTVDKLNRIIVRPSKLFNIRIIDDILNIGVPSSLCYDTVPIENSSEIEEFFWCEDNYEKYGIRIITGSLHITRKQLLFVLCHELNHYLNGDLSKLKSILFVLFCITTNIFTLLLLCYFVVFVCNLHVSFTLIFIIWNHMYTMMARRQEQKADIDSFCLMDGMNEEAVLLWKQFKKRKYQNNLYAKFLGGTLNWYKKIVYGRTHPTFDERIAYSSIKSN